MLLCCSADGYRRVDDVTDVRACLVLLVRPKIFRIKTLTYNSLVPIPIPQSIV